MCSSNFNVIKYVSLLIVVAWYETLFAQNLYQDTVSVEKLFGMEMDEILKIKVNVSSTLKNDVFNTPSTVTVIDREMFEQYNFLTIGEALSVVAGFDVYESIIDRNIPTSRGILQGFYANKILLMINNVPTWQPIYGNGFIDRVDINDVKRIEVLKGPASVLYGSNAYSGVINIVLDEKKADGTTVGGYVRGGNNHVAGTGTNIQINRGDFNLFFSANTGIKSFESYSITSARGFSYLEDSVFQYSPEEETRNFNFLVRYKSHSLFFNRFHFDHTFMGVHPSYVGGGGKTVKNQGLLLSYGFNKEITTNLRFKFDATWDEFKRNFPLSQDLSNAVYLAGQRFDFDSKLNYKLNRYFDFELGAKYEIRQSLGHNTYNGIADTLIRNNMRSDKDVIERSTFAQLQFNYRFFKLLVGSRYTNNMHFGDNLSSRITSLLKLNKSNSFKFILGQSFRVPTMFELYFDHPTVVGNTELTPELSKSAEISYTSHLGKWYFNLTGYRAYYENLITRVTPNQGQPSEYINSADFEANGIEVEIKYQNPFLLNFFVNYNTNWATDHTGEEHTFRYVPDHTIAFGANKAFARWNVAVNGKWYSEVNGHLEDISPQFLLNSHVGFTHYLSGISLKHKISFRNITDSKQLVPEYIRKTANVNTIRNLPYGRTFVYSIVISL